MVASNSIYSFHLKLRMKYGWRLPFQIHKQSNNFRAAPSTVLIIFDFHLQSRYISQKRTPESKTLFKEVCNNSSYLDRARLSIPCSIFICFEHRFVFSLLFVIVITVALPLDKCTHGVTLPDLGV